MRSNLSDNFIPAALAIPGAALAVITCVATAMPISIIASVSGGALFLFSFIIAENVTGNRIRNPFASGKTSRALLITTAVFTIAGVHPVSAVTAGIIFIIAELTAGVLFRNISSFFAGIISHTVLAVFAFFLITKNQITYTGLISIAVAPFRETNILPLIAIPFMLAVFILLPRFADKISPINRETSPAVYFRVSRWMAVIKEISFFAAFLLCGAVLLPFNFLAGKKTFFAAFLSLIIYISIAVLSSAAVRKGFAMQVLAAVVCISYLQWILSVRRTHAGYKRTFIHDQRNSRS